MDKLLEHLSRIGDILTVVIPALFFLVRWANKWLSRIKNDADFNKSVARTHLPHIYGRLRRVDDTLKLPVLEHPDITYQNGSPTPVVGRTQ
jgi:hypothetical protein